MDHRTDVLARISELQVSLDALNHKISHYCTTVQLHEATA
jgi:hypothetical protein